MKSLQRVPTPITRSASRASRLAAGGAGRADRAERERMVGGQRAAAGLRLADRDAGRVDERAQRGGRLAVDDAAAGDDQRPLARARTSSAARASASGAGGWR